MKDAQAFENLIETKIREGFDKTPDDAHLRLIEAGIKLLSVRTRKKDLPEDEGAFFNGRGADEGRADS